MSFKIDQTRHLMFVGQITEESIAEFVPLFSSLEQESISPIYISICSPGGDVGPTLWLADIIRCSANKVIGIACGAVNSSAITLLSACDYRVAYPSTTFYFHPMIAEYGTQHPGEMKAASAQYHLLNDAVCKIEAEAVGLSTEQYSSQVDHHMVWDVVQAKHAGLIQHVIEWRPRA